LPDVKLLQRRKDWLHGIGSVTGGLILGFTDLSFPSVPVWAWAALAPGLYLFISERPGLISSVSKIGLSVGQCFHKAAGFALTRPRWTAGIAASFIAAVAAAGALFDSNPLLGFAIISGVIKTAYTGAEIALLIAAGRGLAGLATRTRQITGQLAAGASEAGREMLRLAAKFARPVLKLGKMIVRPASRDVQEKISSGFQSDVTNV
jgi:hypothetical protein